MAKGQYRFGVAIAIKEKRDPIFQLRDALPQLQLTRVLVPGRAEGLQHIGTWTGFVGPEIQFVEQWLDPRPFIITVYACGHGGASQPADQYLLEPGLLLEAASGVGDLRRQLRTRGEDRLVEPALKQSGLVEAGGKMAQEG